MYLLAKFGNHRFSRNEDVNFFFNFYMNTLEKAELTALVRHIERFLESGMPIHNPEVLDTDGRKTRRRGRGRRRRKTKAIAKRFMFRANAKDGEKTFIKQEVREQDKESQQNIILSKEEIVQCQTAPRKKLMA